MKAQSELLNRKTASESVAEQLRAEVQRGDLRPGERLRQGEVARRFGVSTTPVREAFALLQAQGLVRIDPHRGAIVFHPTAEDVRELYEIRTILETLAISKAVAYITPGVLDRLQKLIDEMSETEHSDRWLQLHNEFHIGLYRLAGRPRLVTLIANLRDAASSYINMFVSDHKGAGMAGHGHREILEACRARDTAAARRAIKAHLETAVDRLTASLEEPQQARRTDVHGVA
jgi:DNA-binding GntR family transcriptional regulator